MRRLVSGLVTAFSVLALIAGPAIADDRTPDASTTIYFSTLSAKLTPTAKAALRDFVADQPEGTEYGVEGFVQRAGSPSNNITLSRAREQATRAFLLGLGATDVAMAGGRGVYPGAPTANAARRVAVYAYHPVVDEQPPAPAVYTVTYDANGGSVSPTSASFTSGGSALTLPAPTRTGYRFDGWFTAATGGTLTGLAGAAFSPTASVTLYAHWTLLPYTVRYDANGGDPTGLTPQTFLPGGTPIVAPAPLSGPGDFDGWFTAPTGGTRVTYGGQPFSPAGDITLYAHWVIPPQLYTTLYVEVQWLSGEGYYGTATGCVGECPVDIVPNGQFPDYTHTFTVLAGGTFVLTLEGPWHTIDSLSGAQCDVQSDYDAWTTTFTCSGFTAGSPASLYVWQLT